MAVKKFEKFEKVFEDFNEVFDLFFGRDIRINDTEYMKTVPTPDRPFLRRYAISIDKILKPEEIRFLDRRLKRIGTKRDFDFTGSFGSMVFVIDINAIIEDNKLKNFTSASFAVDPKMIYEVLTTINTDMLGFSSACLSDCEPGKKLEKTIKQMQDWLKEQITQGTVYNILREQLEMFASEPFFGYESLIALSVSDEKDEDVTIIPGIVPRKAEAQA